jgi:hypothetical protein
VLHCLPALTQRQIEKHFVLLFLSFFLLLGGAKKFNQVALVSAHAPASRANFHEISREIAVEKSFLLVTARPRIFVCR